MKQVDYKQFEEIEIRVGRVVKAEDFPKAKRPAYKLLIDFGDLGVKKTSAQITALYNKEELIGRQVVAVVNFPPRQIADFKSEVLLLGAVVDTSEVVLLKPDRDVPHGCRVL
ncbi:MAG TPA: tRNA-binding protein [Spirochaetota bacterium]|nr:tRNA-binding protein [Spirochaetota bacterium]